jgi:hypothetical protein
MLAVLWCKRSSFHAPPAPRSPLCTYSMLSKRGTGTCKHIHEYIHAYIHVRTYLFRRQSLRVCLHRERAAVCVSVRLDKHTPHCILSIGQRCSEGRGCAVRTPTLRVYLSALSSCVQLHPGIHSTSNDPLGVTESAHLTSRAPMSAYKCCKQYQKRNYSAQSMHRAKPALRRASNKCRRIPYHQVAQTHHTRTSITSASYYVPKRASIPKCVILRPATVYSEAQHLNAIGDASGACGRSHSRIHHKLGSPGVYQSHLQFGYHHEGYYSTICCGWRYAKQGIGVCVQMYICLYACAFV